jgi:hypothetical protein
MLGGYEERVALTAHLSGVSLVLRKLSLYRHFTVILLEFECIYGQPVCTSSYVL